MHFNVTSKHCRMFLFSFIRSKLLGFMTEDLIKIKKLTFAIHVRISNIFFLKAIPFSCTAMLFCKIVIKIFFSATHS